MSIKNIAIGLIALAKKKLGGEVDQQSIDRLAICYECNDRSEQCPVCLCFVQAKVLVKEEKCPKALWL